MEKLSRILHDLDQGNINVGLAKQQVLDLFGVSKLKFAVEWMRNVNYGIGSGTEYFDADSKEDALMHFWDGKNKEAFEVNTVYVC